MARHSDGGGLFAIPAAGGQPVLVGPQVPGSQVAWSPDGRTIAYAAEQIHLIDADGSNDRVLADPGDGEQGVGFPAWAPDGQRIVFLAWGAGDMSPRSLEVIDVDGTGRRVLQVQSVGDRPAWGPDNRIAFGNAAAGGLATVNPDTGDVRPLTADDDAFAAWSPDGLHLAFHQQNPAGEGHRIVVANAFGGGGTFVSAGPEDEYAAWSPDGLWVAFSRFDAEGYAAIFIARADGGGERQLTPFDSSPIVLSWRP